MAVFSVDSDAVLSATSTIRGTMERLQAESSTLMNQLTQLQSSWTGSAAVAFHGSVDQWRSVQHTVEENLGSIGTCLSRAAEQYAQIEAANASMFQ